VSSVSLGIALRYVLEALRTGPGSKMFRFAVTALKQFAGDLSQWPQYCTHLTQVGAGAARGQRCAAACLPAPSVGQPSPPLPPHTPARCPG
jgi:CCR4-NOT transcription complex subunit 1